MQLIYHKPLQLAAGLAARRLPLLGAVPRSRSGYLRSAASLDVRTASRAGASPAAPATEDVPAATAAVKPPRQKQQKQQKHPQVGVLPPESCFRVLMV